MATETNLYVSGGKDSAYMILFCKENGIKVDRYIFQDCTLELPIVYDFLLYLENLFSITIEKVKTHNNFNDKFYSKITKGKHKGKIRGFPLTTWLSRGGCWIKRDLKQFKENENEKRIVAYTSDETKRIKNRKNFIYPFVENGIDKLEVIKRCKQNKIFPPIYYQLSKYGAKKPRSGCWLCPASSLGWCRLLYYDYPELWKRLETLEHDSPWGWKGNTTTRELAVRFDREREKYYSPLWFPWDF